MSSKAESSHLNRFVVAGSTGAEHDAIAGAGSHGRPAEALGKRTDPDGQRRAIRSPRISCVVPARDESANLAQLLPRLFDVLKGLGSDWEVIIVDDGSTDATARVVEPWCAGGHVRLVQLSRNFGKEAALSAGLERVGGDVAILLDADLQHPPELIPTMVEQWRTGVDVVYACIAQRRGEPLGKRMGAALAYRLLNIGGQAHIPAHAGDFRLLDRAVVDAIVSMPERNRFMKGLYAWVGFRSVALPYTPAPRTSGKSHYSIWRLAALALDGIAAFTSWPLRAVFVCGAALALASISYGTVLTIAYLLDGNPVSGWTTLAVGLMFFSGVQLVSLGIVGEYVGRIYREVKGRPLVVVRRDIGTGLK
ncbi:MAG: glycosyltransferase family 2 protein [Burkholderiaceae bacterium]|nr:glycosyltransferase family 2 protein [Burkholderiaceae bacterium]